MASKFCVGLILIGFIFISPQARGEATRSKAYHDLWEGTKAGASAVGRYYKNGYKSFWRDTKRDLAPLAKKFGAIDFKLSNPYLFSYPPGEKAKSRQLSTEANQPGNDGSMPPKSATADSYKIRRSFILAVRQGCSYDQSGDMYSLISFLNEYDQMLRELEYRQRTGNKGYGYIQVDRNTIRTLAEMALGFIHLKMNTLPENETATTSSLRMLGNAIQASARSVGLKQLKSTFLTKAWLEDFKISKKEGERNDLFLTLIKLHEAARTPKSAYCKVEMDLATPIVEYHDWRDQRTMDRSEMGYNSACKAAGGVLVGGVCECDGEVIMPQVSSCLR